jgi:glycosyltransferase 2 family protein
LVQEVSLVPIWFVVAVLIYMVFSVFIGGARWSFLVIKEPKFVDFWNFTKATYIGTFYGLFFPTAVAGDLVKWLPLLKIYKDVSKTRLAGSVVIDRVIGLSAFITMAFVALIVGKILHYQFPDVLLWLFSGLVLGAITFYLLVFTIDFEKLFGRIRILKKVLEVVNLLKVEDKRRILKVYLLALVGEPIWMMPVWFYSLIFHAGISLLQVYIFMPVIALILILPISVAGFGARENLYLYFFGALGFVDEKILLVSTFGGIMGILSALLGGLLILLQI